MKKIIFLLLMLITFNFVIYSEPVNDNNIESMLIEFLNKGTYIKIKKYSYDNTFYYYQKHVIAEISLNNNYLSFRGVKQHDKSISCECKLARDQIYLDDNYNLIIIICNE